ncbi:MAG TPA: hypothetical protein PKA63_02440 [Oligoflexia bacterium]|nr:hypothetical protein [Oligoflexia bacterium]HMP47510.1 hypothetical protein [Oligoflexia bacterium]
MQHETNKLNSIFSYLLFLLLLIFFPSTNSRADNEKTESLNGHLIVRIVDRVDGTHQYIRSIKDEHGNHYRLDFDNSIRNQINVSLNKSGIRLVVEGQKVTDSIFSVKKFNVISREFSGFGGTAVTGARSILVIMIDFPGKSQTCSKSNLDSTIFTNPTSTRAQFEASSRNLFTFKRDTNEDGLPDIVGPFVIAENTGSCDNIDGWATAAKNAATGAGVNLNLYKHIFYSMPRFDLLGCSFAGIADLGCPLDFCEGWMLFCESRNTWSHELGHNLGMEHSSTDLNNDGVLDDEYGDYSCPMGLSYDDMLFNSMKQEQMGWLDAFPGKKAKVSVNGAFSLVALETNPSDSSNPMTLIVQKAPGDFYYLTYRSNIGTFNKAPAPFSNTINVHRWVPNDLNNRKSRFITSLTKGQSWTDPSMGLTFCGGDLTPTHAAVGISLSGNQCSADNPQSNPPPNDDSGEDNDSITSLPGDADGDGISDAQEITDGSDQNDPGSYFSRLSSPTFVLWNGFLSMINILELINPSASESTLVDLSLFDINGLLRTKITIPLGPGIQRDVIVNELTGFSPDSYGIIKLEYQSAVTGRMSFYRSMGSQYEFAYSVPFDRGTKGKSVVSFNTFQPSTNPLEQNFQVFNWLSLVNLEESVKSFSVRTYNQTGNRISSRIVNVPARGRVDIDGGHGLVGKNVVGMHQIIPSDPAGEYTATLVRYGSRANPGQVASSYDFSFPISSRSGNGRPQLVPISRQFGQTNWLEVINTRKETIPVNLQFTTSAGSQTSRFISLAPFSQTHISIDNSILQNGDLGFAKITPTGNRSIIAQSMNYFRNSSGSIEGMFGTVSRETLGNHLTGSFNLFLGMNNFLVLSNTSNQPVTVQFLTNSPGGLGNTSFPIIALGTLSISVKDTASFLAGSDTYGSIKLVPSNSGVVLADLIRLKPAGSGFDFAFPTEVRPELP